MLTTNRLFLMPLTLPMLRAAVAEDWDTLSSLLGGVYFAENWNRFPEAMQWGYDRLKAHPDEIGWWGYIILQGLDARVAGICGYKGGPNAEGAVEIGYEIADRYQNQGLATEAADALIRNAFNHLEVTRIEAQTLPEDNASVQVLRHLLFEYVGESFDEEVGVTWKWQRLRDLTT